MNAGVNGRLAPYGQAYFDSLVTFHRDGVKGERVPTITRVYDGTTRLLDTISPGGSFRISGPGQFGSEPPADSTTLGLFLRLTSATTLVQIGSVAEWTDSEIYGAWPAGLSGTYELRAIVKYPRNVSLSTFIYGTNLTVST